MEKSKILSIKVENSKTLEWIGKQSNVTGSINKVLKNFIENNGIDDLTKPSEDYIPTSTEMLNHVFVAIGELDKNYPSNLGIHVQDIYDRVAQNLGITATARTIPSDGGNLSKFNNNVRWCLLKLKELGVIDNTKRGFYKLNAAGKDLYNRGIDVNSLK